ncbi:MAG: glycine--tRNA ligase [Mycoplasma sp.]|nr:glycine--tRNA ligase [Mycoplasma sp.]
MKNIKQEVIVNHLKNYGFVYPCSEIYGGIANGWDYGPLGVLLKQNIKNLWWKEYVTTQPNAVGIDSSIILNPTVWEASGHLKNFNDPLIDCKSCHNRFRADKLIESATKILVSENTPYSEIEKIIAENHIKCPVCGKEEWTNIRNFNLMFKTYLGVVSNDKNETYLRPETAQGIFTNFMNVQRTSRMKLPFAICQIGKAFRNEITPGNFIFRTREFEQMECEYFTYPDDATELFEQQLDKIQHFIKDIVHLDAENWRLKEHDKNDLSHYSSRTVDIEYKFPHGFSELWGIANRGDYDLKCHAKTSKANIWYLDEKTNQKIIPYVIEPSLGVERLFYAICCDTYEEQQLKGDDARVVMHLTYELAPYKVAILPLVNKLQENALKIFNDIISKNISAVFDTSGSIGKRYRRQDAIGTPFCITFDYDSLKDQCVTIRNRDTMEQERIKITDIIKYLDKNKI